MYYKDKKITKRTDGRYMIRFTQNGKRIYIYGKNKKSVIENYKKKIRNNDNFKTVNITFFKSWVSQWFILYKSDKSNNTKKLINYIITNYFSKQNFWIRDIKSITTIELNIFLSTIEKTKIKQMIYIYLKDIFDKALKNELVLKNPIVNIDKPKHIKKEKVYLESKDFNLFFKAIENSKYKVLYITILTSGMRIGEALAINKNDIDAENKTIQISKQKTTNITDITKTENSKRFIVLPDMTINLLMNYENDFLFNNFTYSNVMNNFNKIKNKLPKKYKNLTLHGLRHSYASFLLENKIDIKSIQTLLGHTNINTTTNIYTHVSKKLINENSLIINKLNGFFDTKTDTNYKK